LADPGVFHVVYRIGDSAKNVSRFFPYYTVGFFDGIPISDRDPVAGKDGKPNNPMGMGNECFFLCCGFCGRSNDCIMGRV